MKRFLRAGFYVKKEGHGYWLGHYCEEKMKVVRMRISPLTYKMLLKEARLCRVMDRFWKANPKR